MSGNFDDVLNDCLEHLARGEDIQQCISRYPEYREELLSLLSLANAMRRLAASASHSPQAKIRGLARLNRTIAARRKPTARQLALNFWRPLARPLLVGFAVVFFTLVAAGGTTVASSNSLPGDPLYWVKTTRENVSLRMPGSELDKAQAHARLAGERGKEMHLLIARGRFYEAEHVVWRLRHHLDQSATHAGVLLPADRIEMPARPIEIHRMRKTIILRQALEKDEIVLKVRMVELLREVPPHQQRRIRRILFQSDLRYRIVIQALEDGDSTGQGHYFRIEPFPVPAR